MHWFSFVAVWAYAAAKRYSEHGCTLLSAGISYYVLFSIFPLLIFSVGVIGLLLQDQAMQEDLVDAVMRNIPLTQDQGRADVAEAISRVSATSSSAIGVLGLITMAWAGSSMFGAVRRSLNIAGDVEVNRPWIPQKLLDLSMVLFFAPFFLASIAATTALRAAEARSDDIPVLGSLADDLGPFWWLASILLPMTFSFFAFTFLYGLVPVTRPRLRHVIPGAVIASLLFEFAKLAFSFYLERFDNYDVVFGSLGAVVAFMFWVYVSASILLYGAELIASLPLALDKERQPTLDDARPPVPLSTKIVKVLKGFVISPKT